MTSKQRQHGAPRRGGPKGKQGYHHGDLRRALLEASLQIIRREGKEALTLREVARRAGVSHAAPYRHFASKEALLAAVAEEGFHKLEAEMTAQRDRHSAPIKRFQATGVGYVRFALAHPAHFQVMFAHMEAPAPGLAQAGQTAFGVMFACLMECQKTGSIRAGEPLRLALSAWAMVHGLAHLLIEHAFAHLAAAGLQGTPESHAEAVVQDLFQGLGA